MNSSEGFGKGIDRRRFFSAAAASAASIALSSIAEGKESKIESDGYEIGSGVEELTRPLVDELARMLRKIDKQMDIDRLPEEVRERIFKYLDNYGASLLLTPEQRTRAVDAEALMYATKDARARPGLDRRILEVLNALFESAVRQTARESLALVPLPDVRDPRNDGNDRRV